MMKKVREFVEKHGDAIALVGGGIVIAVGGVLIGCELGYNNCIKRNTVLEDGTLLKSIIDDSISVYNNRHSMWGIARYNVSQADLGAIGKCMAEAGVPAEKVFTHFIAIGEPESK